MLIYKMGVGLRSKRVIAGDGATVNAYADEESPDGWVRYEDAQALVLRIAELEQQLKTPEQKRERFEQECG